MKFFRCFYLALLACSFANAAVDTTQQTFQLSSKVYTMDFSQGKFPGLVHRFNNVFCLPLPPDLQLKEISYALYNNNGIYFSHIAYRDPTVLYVVTSGVPADRSVEEEIGILAARNEIGMKSHPGHFKQFQKVGLLGPSLVQIVRNARQGKKESPFPLAWNVISSPNGQMVSLSVHRLFVRGGQRIELAGLRYFDAPVHPDREEEAVADLSSFVESAADALQSCTANLPARVQQ
jgi:hypothetical protein